MFCSHFRVMYSKFCATVRKVDAGDFDEAHSRLVTIGKWLFLDDEEIQSL